MIEKTAVSIVSSALFQFVDLRNIQKFVSLCSIPYILAPIKQQNPASPSFESLQVCRTLSGAIHYHNQMFHLQQLTEKGALYLSPLIGQCFAVFLFSVLFQRNNHVSSDVLSPTEAILSYPNLAFFVSFLRK